MIDVAGGDKVPRKGGPGITQSDLLVINKTDLAQAVGADMPRMEREARQMREGEGPVILAQVKFGVGVDDIVREITKAWNASGARAVQSGAASGGLGVGEKRKSEQVVEGGSEGVKVIRVE